MPGPRPWKIAKVKKSYLVLRIRARLASNTIWELLLPPSFVSAWEGIGGDFEHGVEGSSPGAVQRRLVLRFVVVYGGHAPHPRRKNIYYATTKRWRRRPITRETRPTSASGKLTEKRKYGIAISSSVVYALSALDQVSNGVADHISRLPLLAVSVLLNPSLSTPTDPASRLQQQKNRPTRQMPDPLRMVHTQVKGWPPSWTFKSKFFSSTTHTCRQRL